MISLQGLKKRLLRRIRPTHERQLYRYLVRKKGELTPRLRNQIREYAIEVLGSSRHTDGLFIYTVLCGEFKPGWIPQSYYRQVVGQRIKGNLRSLARFQVLNASLFSAFRVPDIAYYFGESIYNTELSPITVDDLPSLVGDDDTKVVVKADTSARGEGVRIATVDEIVSGAVPLDGAGVIQRFVHQHDSLRALSSTAVATFRVTSVINSRREPEVRGFHLRIGRPGQTHIMSSNQIKIAVDPSTGQLSDQGYDSTWHSHHVHPDTGISFENHNIPALKCAELAVEMHKQVPFLCCIGWDITLDRNGDPVFLEWNAGNNDIQTSEVLQGPCFIDLGWTDAGWRER